MLEWWNNGMSQERQRSAPMIPSFPALIPSFQFYSQRSAAIGSIRAARRAGR